MQMRRLNQGDELSALQSPVPGTTQTISLMATDPLDFQFLVVIYLWPPCASPDHSKLDRMPNVPSHRRGVQGKEELAVPSHTLQNAHLGQTSRLSL